MYDSTINFTLDTICPWYAFPELTALFPCRFLEKQYEHWLTGFEKGHT
jgi:hypothetical protein